jgi:hypothetical protein
MTRRYDSKTVVAGYKTQLAHPGRYGARCRVRTCTTSAEHQEVSRAGTQIDAQKPRHGFEICEVIEAWSELPEPLRAAVLAIIRSHKGELSTVERRQPSNGRASREAAMLARSALSGSETDCGQLEKPDTKAGNEPCK